MIDIIMIDEFVGVRLYRIEDGDHLLHVATSLPPGYLQHEQLGMGKGVSDRPFPGTESGIGTDLFVTFLFLLA